MIDVLYLLIDLVLLLHDCLALYKGRSVVVVMEQEWPHICSQLGLDTPEEYSTTESEVILNHSILKSN